MILIRGFANLDELNHYRKVMASSPDFKLPPGVRPVAISVANFEKMMNEGRTFDDYFRYLEEQNYVDAQAGILQPEEVETLDEADEADKAAHTDPSDKSDKSAKTDKSDKSDSSPRSPKSDSSPRSKQPQAAYDPGSEGDDPLLDD